MDATCKIFRLFYTLKIRNGWYFFQAKSVPIVNDLLTSNNYLKEKFVFLRSHVGFRVNLT